MCEYITYRLSSDGKTLLRVNKLDSSSAGDPVAEYVNGLNFQYLKSDGTTATTESEIAIVQITLSISKGGGAFGNGTQKLTTDVALRNRGN